MKIVSKEKGRINDAQALHSEDRKVDGEAQWYEGDRRKRKRVVGDISTVSRAGEL